VLKGFKDFIMRGNVIDLSVGIVIGTAFATVVTGFTDAFLKPLLAAVGPKDGRIGMTVPLPGPANNALDFGGFISAVIAFLMTAAVVYFLVVLPMNKLAERRKKGEEPEQSAPSEEVRLLMEIRDALVAQRGTDKSAETGVAPVPRSSEEPEKSGSSR
jgi:large conductance mechanosensitive channel